MTEQERIELAKMCEYSHELYTDFVKEGVDIELGLGREEEIAFLRKAMDELITLYEAKFGEINTPAIVEFKKYTSLVEQKKQESKDKIGI